MSVRDKIAKMYTDICDTKSCCEFEGDCKLCGKLFADAILAIEVEGTLGSICEWLEHGECAHDGDCPHDTTTDKTCMFTDRPATIGDLICDNYKKEE
jgi:hypothetical protein